MEALVCPQDPQDPACPQDPQDLLCPQDPQDLARPQDSQDLLCPQCRCPYTSPLLLRCGHNICRLCLQIFWDSKGCRECPVCGAASVPARPPVNLQLKIAAKEFRTQGEPRTQVCPKHNQRLEKFCENDQEVICLQCERNLHRIHQCLTLEEAAEGKKKEVSESLGTLRKRLKQLNKRREEWEETKDYIQTQEEQSEAILRAEFEELRAFLQEEEENRVSLLKQERDVKTGVLTEKIQDLQNQIQSLTETIRDLEASVQQKDLLFLQNYKHIRKSSRSTVLEPVCLRDILLNSASHLGILKFQVWKKMKNIVKFAPVTFDPNTAQSNLTFSESLTCVRYSSKTPVPETPERCVNRVCVLGTPGFSSGRHRWTVDVRRGQDWYIGVARESIQRKSTVFLEPAEGFWVIGRTGGDSYWAQTASRSRLTVKQPPQRVTVEVDYGKGKVTFVNNTDGTVMHTFKDKFTEKIFPYFCLGLYQEEVPSCPLGICGHSISLLMD